MFVPLRSWSIKTCTEHHPLQSTQGQIHKGGQCAITYIWNCCHGEIKMTQNKRAEGKIPSAGTWYLDEWETYCYTSHSNLFCSRLQQPRLVVELFSVCCHTEYFIRSVRILTLGLIKVKLAHFYWDIYILFVCLNKQATGTSLKLKARVSVVVSHCQQGATFRRSCVTAVTLPLVATHTHILANAPEMLFPTHAFK